MPWIVLQHTNKEKSATLQPDGLSIYPLLGAAEAVAVISLLLLQNQQYHSV
jgi:hypothetical protein